MSVTKEIKALKTLQDDVIDVLIQDFFSGCSENSVGGKKVLYTRGAQAICKVFNWTISFQNTVFLRDLNESTIIAVICELKDSDGALIGSGMGAASAREDMFLSKESGMTRPDAYNSMVKMACNRALVAAVINTAALGSLLTQDVQPPSLDPSDDDIEEESQEILDAAAKKANAVAQKPQAQEPKVLDAQEKKMLAFWKKSMPDVVKAVIGDKGAKHKVTYAEYCEIKVKIQELAKKQINN